MRVNVTHGIGDLARDLKRIPKRARRDMRQVVRQVAVVGNQVAKDNARRSSGKHGKHYPDSFKADGPVPSLFGGAGFSAEYGPVASKKQGAMSFEHGSRNQPPHHDLAKSADLIGPTFAQEVRGRMDDWFWIGGDQ